MAARNSAVAVGKQIRTLFDAGALRALPDRGLLDQFAAGGETAEAAFATLVERHGAMVLRVCRQLLSDEHLADDAFQVTFLLLSRRARSIHDPDALAGWLHRVAWRVALRAQAEIRRRHRWERPQGSEVADTEGDPIERDELGAIVHEEINRLRDAQRLPIVLCMLEGLSHEEAARRLRWPVGTVKSRLVRGRRQLSGRLARRGLAPAIALATVAAQTSPTAAAPVPLVLAVATTRAALASSVRGIAATAGPVSRSIASLVHKELSTILLAKLALAGSAALVVGAAILIVLATAGAFGTRGPAIGPSLPQTLPLTVERTPIVPARSVATAAETPRKTLALSERKTIPEPARSLARVPSDDPGPANNNPPVLAPERRLSALGREVVRAIHDGVGFLKAQQRPDGSWVDVEVESKTGTTSLVTLALLTAGEKSDSPAISKALDYLRQFGPNDLRSTYAIALQTMVFATAEPANDRLRIEKNVSWLERAQITPADPVKWAGSWSYSGTKRARPGDGSNTHYALLGLQAASEAGVPVKPAVWELARAYWETGQKPGGGWAYTPDTRNQTASMTAAGVSSLAITGRGRFRGQEFLQGESIENCAKGGTDAKRQAGIHWLTEHFQVRQNLGNGQQWKFYYLYDLEHAGRLSGLRYFGKNDWFRLGAEDLVREQNRLSGHWEGSFLESQKLLATSFALLFLARGRAPVLINKLIHAPETDWDNDPDDVRNIVNIVARKRRSLLTWQLVDSKTATVSDLLRAPILFINGHQAPEFTRAERMKLRAYVDNGGFIFAEACCGSADFDRGLKKLMAELFPDKQEQLRPLPDDHPLWRSRSLLSPDIHPLMGISRGGRTAVIYSPSDLSCYWNQAERTPASPAVIKAIRVGENVIDHVTRRQLPPDKLSEPLGGPAE